MSHDERCVTPLVFPAAITNRPALPRIAYRIGTYAEVREALLRWRDTTPALQGWTYRGADDPGVALLEGAAILTDILSFYQELYANECFLRTATWRDSIAELVRLTGYRLAPSMGGRAMVSARVSGDQPLVVPAGFPLTAPLAGGTTATLETTSELTAHPWLNEVPVYAVGPPPSITWSTSSVIADGDVQVRKGDRLMFGRWGDSGGTQIMTRLGIVVVAGVRPVLGKTVIDVRGTLPFGGDTSTTVYRLGRSYRHFGHNAPPTFAGAGGAAYATTYERFGEAAISSTAMDGTTPRGDLWPALAGVELPLDAEAPELVAGDRVLYVPTLGEPFGYLRTVRSVTGRSMSWGPVTARISVLTVDAPMRLSLHFGSGAADFPYDIRLVDAHVILDELSVTAAPATGAGAPLHIYGTGAEAELLAERRLLAITADGAEPIEVTVVPDDVGDANVARLRPITMVGAVALAPETWDTPAARLLGNVVEVTEGATQPEVTLGNGDARRAWQSFRLPKAPLTYLRDPVAGRAPALTLFVDGRAWRRVESLVGAASSEEVYVVREDERGDSHIQAGDGVTGRRFPSGVDNVVARYRVGAGSHGAPRDGAAVRGARRLARLDRFDLPGVVSGGDAAETADVARRAAPARLQSLGRLVSFADYEAEALALPGVEEAAARWDEVDGVASIVVTVLMSRGRGAEVAAVRDALRAAERCCGPRRHPLLVRGGSAAYVYAHASIALVHGAREDTVTAAVAAALGVGSTTGGLFGADTRRFGAPEYATRVLGVIQNAPGVRWATLVGFASLGDAAELDDLTLPATPVVAPTIACPADHVLRLDTSDAVRAFAVTFVDGVTAECDP